MSNKYDNFDAYIYKYINIDLKHLTDKEAYEHFINIGISEDRKYKLVMPSDFDPENYKKINNDLDYLTDDQAFQHFNNYGFYENRKYKTETPADFNVNQYKNLNRDLEYMTDEEAIDHYNKYGVYENRIYKVHIPYDFNVLDYKELNGDLQILSNVLDYKELNGDLQILSNIEASKHYELYGSKEGRIYKLHYENLPIDFNILNYKEFNEDLQNLSDIEITKHYIMHGIREGRIYKLPSYNINMFNYTNINLPNYRNLKTIYEDIILKKFISVLNRKSVFSYSNIISFYSYIIKSIIKDKIIEDPNFIENLYCSYPTTNYLIIQQYNISYLFYVKNVKYLNPELIKVYDSYENKEKYIIYPFLNFPLTSKQIILTLIEENKIKKWDYNIINLKHRSDNLDQVLSNIKNIDWLKPIRFEAIKHEKGYLGCTLSHLNILKKYQNKSVNVLIIEDDNLIINDKKLYDILNILDSNIFSWDIFLGSVGNHGINLKGQIYVNNIEFLNVVNFTKTNFCYYNKNVINNIISYEETYLLYNSHLKFFDRYLNLYNVFTSYDVCIVDNKFSEIECRDNSEEKNEIANTYNILKYYENYNQNILSYKLVENKFIFHPLIYKELNKDVQNISGIQENKICKYENTPDDFNVSLYKELNIDLQDLTDIEAKLHYEIIGYEENRVYRNEIYKYENIPNDFDVLLYKELNRDLQIMTDLEAKIHYNSYGYKENRVYKYENIPNDFDVSIYKELNKDLQVMTDLEAKMHYNTAGGIKENRLYKDIHFNKDFFSKKYNLSIKDNKLYSKYIEDIRQLKNDYFSDYVDNIIVSSDINYIFLVNHDNTLYGASHYVYSLFVYLNNKYKFKNVKIFLCEFEYNIALLNKYSIGNNNVLEYHADPTLLYMLYDKIKPKVVYLNSCNYAISKVYKYIPEHVRILHSHEIFDHYLISKEIMPDYVVCNLIADQYFQYYKKTPNVQPPFLKDIDNILLLSTENMEIISNQYGNLDLKKITIGMCGQITERKNYELFISMSKIYLNYNFIWIGDTSNILDEYVNIYHIKTTNNPYKYYKQVIDYFILFSKQDPCPYVILENILLESNIITFDKNIYYHHNSNLLEKTYFRCNDEINSANCKTMIDKYVTSKKNNTSRNGYKYVNEYFTKPNNIENKIDIYLNND
jgi:hypothetical protein